VESSKLRGVGVALVGAKFAILPLIFDFGMDLPFVVSKAIVSHALAVALAAVIAALFVRFRASLIRWSPLHIPILIYLGVNVLAAAFAANSTIALFGTHARMLGLVMTIDLAVLYFAIVVLVLTRSDAIALGIAAYSASLVVLAYEAIQLAGHDPLPWASVFVTRPFSTLGQPTVLAQYLTVLAIAAFALAIVWRAHLLLRALLLGYSAVLLSGAVATGTRSLLVGLAAGIATFVLLVWLVHPSRSTRVFSFAGGALASVAATAVLLFTPLGERLASTIESSAVIGDDTAVIDRIEPSVAARLVLYEIGLEIVRERPLLGYGPDNFTVGVPRYRPERGPELVRQSAVSSAHSWLVHVATDSGVVGAASFVAIAVTAFVLAVRGRFSAIVIATVAALAGWIGTGATTVNEIGTEWLFWACVGCVGAVTSVPIAGRLTGHRRAQHRSRVPLAMISAKALILIAAAVAVLAGANSLEASRLARDSDNARLAGNRAAAVRFGESAIEADPRRAEYWHKLGLAYAGVGRLREATDAFERAASLTPHDVRFLGDLARARLILGNSGDTVSRARAVELGDRVTQVDRNNPQSHLTRALVRQASGDLPEAIRSVERAFTLDPNSINERLYITATQVLIDTGRTTEAVRTAREGLDILVRTVQSYELRFELARALTVLGQFSDALSEVERALAIRPNYPQAEQLRLTLRAELAKRGAPP
jgi:tetratricopeptide (TPR) repeat protein/O-antigen ligase